MTYGGVTAYGYTTRVLARGPNGSWWISYNLGAVPLPGGNWGCEFSFGSVKARVRFKSGGPTGVIVGAAVCAGTDTVHFANGKLRVCRSDESASPIQATDEIFCSAVLPRASSKELKIQLLSGGSDVVQPYLDTIGGPLWIEGADFKTDSADGRFAAGDYLCRFSLDGVPVAEKAFRIAGA